MLLFRGADKSILNYSNQDALQVAAISGNNDLGKIIQNFSSDEVGKLYNLALTKIC